MVASSIFWIRSERQAGRRVLGYTVWEIERLPNHWPAILNRLDGVIVPCQWNVEVFRRSGVVVPIHVVPHLPQFETRPGGPTPDVARLQARNRTLAASAGRFVFYTVGYWSNRKAPYLAIEAYLRAFRARDPVLMVVKTNHEDVTRLTRRWQNRFRRSHPPPTKAVAALVGGG